MRCCVCPYRPQLSGWDPDECETDACMLVNDEACGTYFNFKNKVAKEPSLKIEKIIDDELKYIRFDVVNNCQIFKRKFNLETILFTIEEIEYEVV